jgi:hypothetical protein
VGGAFWMRIRTANLSDATAMSAILERLVAAGRRKMAADVEYVCLHHV